MRTTVAILVVALGFSACSKGENAGAEEAKKQAQAEKRSEERRVGKEC